MNRRFVLTTTVLMSLAVFSGCQSLWKAERKPAGKPIPFVPAQFVSSLRTGQCAYPHLFSAQSYALWVGPEVTAQRRAESEEKGQKPDPMADAAAPEIDANYLVLECHIESVFEDMSIGYDVVGFRGIQVYMLTPDGRKVPPAQIVMGSELEEKSQGALKSFRRTNLIVFPKHELDLRVPKVNGQAASARLVIEGFKSSFYFEWFPVMPGKDGQVQAVVFEGANTAKLGFNDYYGKLRAIAHKFD
jgi:hypothetical protein